MPVVTTLMGIGAVDTTQPLSMRMLGMHGAAFANYAVEDCDFLMAAGARFDDRVAGDPAEFAKNAKFIAHFDIDASEINKVKRVDLSHVGLMPDALRTLTEYGRRLRARAGILRLAGACAELRSRHAMNYDRESALIQPYYVIEEINRLTRGEADHHDRGRPASDVGRRSISISRARVCGSRPAAWAPWVSACRPRSAPNSRNARGS